MASQLQIFNRALIALGLTTTINDVDEPTVPAQLCKEVWPTCLDYVLTMHPWGCAKKRWTIAPDATAPIWGGGLYFTRPAECVAVFEMEGQEYYDWNDESGKIWTDHPGPINIMGNRRVDNPADFDASMVEALAYKIAMEVCVPLTQSKSLREDMEKGLEKRTTNTRTLTSRQRTAQVVSIPTWTGARH